jgi:hypothetical protein
MAMGETWALLPWIDVAAAGVVEVVGVGVGIGGVVGAGHDRQAGGRPQAAARQGQWNDGVGVPRCRQRPSCAVGPGRGRPVSSTFMTQCHLRIRPDDPTDSGYPPTQSFHTCRWSKSFT